MVFLRKRGDGKYIVCRKTVGNKNMASVLAKVVAKNGQIDANSRHQEYWAEFNNSNQNFRGI